MAKVHGTRAWVTLRKQVVAEEPYCWLRLAGCTLLSQTADHLQTVKDRPDLALVRANLRGACTACNLKRGSKTLAQVAAMRGQAEALRFFE